MEKGFNPRVIVAANGISLGAPLKAICEINPEAFPPSIYEEVQMISGTVAVFNPTSNGLAVTNRGTRNTVTFILGRPRKTVLNPWEDPPLFPETESLAVPVGTSATPEDFGSDDPHVSPASSIIIVRASKAKALTEEFDKHLYTRAYEVLRATGGLNLKWVFIHLLQHPQCNIEELNNALNRKHVYKVPTSLVIRPTCDSPNFGVLKAAGINTYKNRMPTHLEYLALYCTPKKAKPIIFPVGDFHVKVIFEDAADFPDFIDFLKDANRTLGSTWFTTLRQGGKEHSLFIGKPENYRNSSGRSSPRAPPAEVGNYILIGGLPLLFNAESIIKRVEEAGISIKRSFWGKNRESELRFIIETTAPVPQGEMRPHHLFPGKNFGFDVEYFFTNSVGEWEDSAGTSSLSSFKFLDEASPAILGSLGDLIEKAKKKFHTISEPSVSLGDSEVVVDPSGSNNNRNPDGIQRNPSFHDEWAAVVGKGGGAREWDS